MLCTRPVSLNLPLAYLPWRDAVTANLVLIDATTYSSSRAIDLSNHLHFIFADSVRTRIHQAVR